MNTYVELKRGFRDLSAKELLEDPDLLAFLADAQWGSADGWDALLESPRVVVLAEAGSGKTREMRERAELLSRDGRYAFFLPLDSLARERPESLLSSHQRDRMKAWREDAHAPAWFFVDSVDELRLTSGKLNEALQRLATSIDPCLGRARVVVSSRPSDWRPGPDSAALLEILPIPPAPAEARTAEELFIAPLRPSQRSHEARSPSSTLRTVVLLQLSDNQIRTYARAALRSDSEDFLRALAQGDAWSFARRPLDLEELIEVWISSRRIGTRTEQLEANVSNKLSDEAYRPDGDVLSDVKARDGAERLALAVLLTRSQTIRAHHQPGSGDHATRMLDPSTILSDWTPRERESLLRRALFDPATYGRIRFHHRSVAEYLAARKLEGLRRVGMSISGLARLLFAERYGCEVVLPSMREVATWLASWEQHVRSEILRREPECLLSYGDPSSVPAAALGTALTKLAELHSSAGSTGLGFSSAQIRRAARLDMVDWVRSNWIVPSLGRDIRLLLLRLIWEGPLVACADLAAQAALDSTWEDPLRVVAIHAVAACEAQPELREIAASLLENPARWPDRVVEGALPSLFPGALSAGELATVLDRISHPSHRVEGSVYTIAKHVPLTSDPAVELRRTLTELIWEHREQTDRPYHARSKHQHLALGLAVLCKRQLDASTRAAPDLVRSSVVASRFGSGLADPQETIAELRTTIRSNAAFREAAFWAELAFVDALAPQPTARDRYFGVVFESTVGDPLKADQEWLKSALRDREDPSRRPVALHGIARLLPHAELRELADLVQDDPDLSELLRELSQPPPPENGLSRRIEARERERALRTEAEHQEWRAWRLRLIEDPAACFNDPAGDSIRKLYDWLSRQVGRRHYNVWNRGAVAAAFSVEVAEQAEAALRERWRVAAPQLWAIRTPEDRNTMPAAWAYGLTGLGAEAESPGWAERLAPEEARLATSYAAIELGGLADFVEDLAKVHPQQVEAVLGEELERELSMIDSAILPTLRAVDNASRHLKAMLAPRLLGCLLDVPTAGPQQSSHVVHNLSVLLGILTEGLAVTHRQALSDECLRRLHLDPLGPSALTLLEALFTLAPEVATPLIVSLASREDSEFRQFAVEAFAEIFGEGSNDLSSVPAPSRAALLADLIRSAYRVVRPDEDPIHDGPYTPDTRDAAASARSHLLRMLKDLPGPETYSALVELSGEEEFLHIRDRLLALARERAAVDADAEPHRGHDVSALEKRLEMPPRNRDELFRTMIDRLDDLAIQLVDDDFTDREMLSRTNQEIDVQRSVAMRLRDAARGCYTVHREAEVADRNRTDIRLSATACGDVATIEVKIADNWSLAELEDSLNRQLVDKYLRPPSSRAGCLLLTHHGKDYWRDAATGKNLSFKELVAGLKRTAAEIEASRSFELRLAVVGVSLV